MRLICPNCDAQYEVADDAIPPEGRDVQCSNCGHAWFQAAAGGRAALDALYAEPEPEPAPPPAVDQEEPAPPRRKLEDSVLAVLREEAEREQAARRAEQQLEMQGDLGLPPPVSPSVGYRAKPEQMDQAEMAQLSTAARKIAAMKGQKLPPDRSVPRKELLPNVEEINSSLKPDEARAKAAIAVEDMPTRSGFRSGFLFVMMVSALGLALYTAAPKLAQSVPALKDPLDRYVAIVDQGRVALDAQLRDASAFVRDLAARASGQE